MGERSNDSAGLRALLAMRDSGHGLEKHYAQVLKIENLVKQLAKDTFAIVEGLHAPELIEKLRFSLDGVNEAVLSITKALNAVKEKIVQKNRSDSTELWRRFDVKIDALKEAFVQLEAMGLDILPENSHLDWKNSIDYFRAKLLPTIFQFARSCRVETEMLERYTAEEMTFIAQIVHDKIPDSFNVDEAEEYEKDYLSALKDFKKEFSEEKNLWDTFLDILAGGTHQSPSEHVMMERWIEGEKRDL
jgi:hypothetical protein